MSVRSLLVVTTLWAIITGVCGKRKLSPTKKGVDTDDDEFFNYDTLQIVFDANCLESEGQSADELKKTILKQFPCLHSNRYYPETIFDTTDYRWVYLDFSDVAGNGKAMRNCIDEEMEFESESCILTSEYEKVAHTYAFDYSTDTCTGLLDTLWEGYYVDQNTDIVDVPVWGVDYWDGAYPDNLYRYEEFNATSVFVDIYILDGAVDTTHDAFLRADGSTRVNALNGVSLIPAGEHGTHVAGTAGGKSTGVSADNFEIYSYPVCFDNGCPHSAIEAGLAAIRDRLNATGRRGTINMSFGGRGTTQTVLNLHSQVHAAGGILVAAAGNDGRDAGNNYPCAGPDVICVGSFDSNLEASSFSSWGDAVDVWAPGERIVSAMPPSSGWLEYGRMDGTSMASPHVTGEVANILQRAAPTDLMTRDDVIAVLIDPRRSIEIPGYRNNRGNGIGVMGQCGEFPPLPTEPVVTEPVVTGPTVTEPVVTTPPVTDPLGCCSGTHKSCSNTQVTEGSCNAKKCSWSQGSC